MCKLTGKLSATTGPRRSPDSRHAIDEYEYSCGLYLSSEPSRSIVSTSILLRGRGGDRGILSSKAARFCMVNHNGASS